MVVKRSVSSALKEKLWLKTGTTELNSPGPVEKPSNLANMHTLLRSFPLLLFLVESTMPHPSHLTQNCSRILLHTELF